ncbi:MAG: acyl carrier protein [Acidimicrobiia bacterium]|nr:acyl carrier protein [Acidimicrobiia bacterium]MYB43403.1 acyl carrier protein [Acidimicrobiia bacterium]MYC86433.1 acyl carrier protein [Acidimicrobiia bacterium]
MDRSQVQAKMRDLLVDELGLDADKITDEATFEEDLEVDSLGVVELLMALEDEFGVKIPDEEAENITAVGEAIDLVVAKLAS